MPEAWRCRLLTFGFLLLCSLGSLSAAWQVRNWGDSLSPVDPFSEANTIREARNFLDTGLAANDGLGNVLRPGLYPAEGFEAYPELRAQSVTPSGVYTHYPPGPEYLLYGAMRVLGPHPVARLRLLPLTISWAAAVFFGFSLRRRFGLPAAALVMLACTVLPVFSDADSYLHYDGYAFALLLVEIGVAIGGNTLVWAFAALGFFQGWLSFDYVFLVTLVPGALELAMGRMGIGHTPRRRLALYRCVAAGGGFACAHLLHFAEIWAFHGSFAAAVHDLGDAATYRSGTGGLLQRLGETAFILKYYIVGNYPISTFFWHPDASVPDNWRVFRFAGLTIGIWWLVLTHVFLVVRKLQQRRAQAGQALRPIDNDWLAVSFYGLLPCTVWYVVMLNHAFQHTHFLYRHLFFGFFVYAMFCSVALAKVPVPAWRRAMHASVRPLLVMSQALRKTAL